MSSISPFVRGPAAQIRATEIVMTQTPPPIVRPSDRDQKYDRQLRLWAQSGQEALEKARILLVNSGCGAVGVETLKNLVLPGIGNFTIFDENTVEEADLGVNFFLDEDCLGKSRAQCCAELLMELNPDAQGDWFPKNLGVDRLEHVLATSPRITMIIFTFPAKEEHIALVENYGRINKTPVIAVHSAGFYGYFRIDLPGPFPIVDTHPDTTATTDLRLLNPWPELTDFARELTEDIENLDNHKHGHLPYVAILLHYLEKWREEHDGADPSTFKEKVAFRNTVETGMRRDNAEGGEENFEEAVASVLKTIVKPSLPSSLREVFEYHPDAAESTSRFWAIAAAVHAFYEKHQRLPVTGSVPDMKAESDVYVRLQMIYKTKALQDAAEVLSLAKQPEGDTVKSEEVQMFCKNAAFVKLINATDRDPNLLQRVAENELTNNDATLLPIYLALSATSSGADKSADQILASIKAVLPNISGAPGYERLVQVAQEVARTGGGELHNISSLLGGMVAQEMIKIITKQYIPIDNTCIFDGIASRCQVVRL